MLGTMWKCAQPVAAPTPVQRIIEATVIKRKTISPMSCEECELVPSDRCWEDFNCLTAYERTKVA